MRTPLTLCLVATLTLSACGQVVSSRFNPVNWWGTTEISQSETQESQTPQRRDHLLARVRDLKVAPHPGGILISVKGQTEASTQGRSYHSLVLHKIVDRPDALTFELRATPPAVQKSGSQTLLGGLFVSHQDLGSARRITVLGAQNRATVARR